MSKTKSYAALTSEKHRAIMESALPSGSLLYADPNPDVARFLADQAEKRTDVVVIDDAGMPYKEISEHDIYSFPATQSSNGHHVQVIFIPSATRLVGDPFINELISVGIYDIIDPHTKDLKGAITKMASTPSVFGDAQGWLTDKVKAKNPQKAKSSSAGLFGHLRKKKAVVDEDADVFTQTETPTPAKEQEKTHTAAKPKVAEPTAASSDIERLRAEIKAVNESKTKTESEPNSPEEKVASLRSAIENTPKTIANVPEKPIANAKVAAPTPKNEPVVSSVTPKTNNQAISGMTMDQLNELVNSRVQAEVVAQLKQQMATENQKRIAISALTPSAGATTFACALAVWLAKELPNKRVVCCIEDNDTLAAILESFDTNKESNLSGLTFCELDSAFPSGDIAVFDCGSNLNDNQRAITAYELSHKQFVVVDGSPMKVSKNIEAIKNSKYQQSAIWVIRNAERSTLAYLAKEAKTKIPRQRSFSSTWSWDVKSVPNMDAFAGDLVAENKTVSKKQPNPQPKPKKKVVTQQKAPNFISKEKKPEVKVPTPDNEPVASATPEPTALPSVPKEPESSVKEENTAQTGAI